MSDKITEFKKAGMPKSDVEFAAHVPYQRLYSCLFNGITDVIKKIDDATPGLTGKNLTTSDLLFAVSDKLKELQQQSEDIFMSAGRE